MKDYEDMAYYPVAEQLVDAIAEDNEDRQFFRIVANYYLTLVASMMRTSIQTPDRGVQPVNMYAINLAPSGFGKGRSTSKIEDEVINQFQHNFVTYTMETMALRHIPTLAARRAAKRGTDPDREEENMRHEYEALGPMAFSFDNGSASAIKQVRQKLLMANAGALNLQIDEIGKKFLGSGEALTAFLELYDGKIKQKLIMNSSDRKRYEDIPGKTPANTLMFGTPTSLLDGGKTEEEFIDFLSVGYARRSWFGFHRDRKVQTTLTPQEILKKRMASQNHVFLQTLSDRLGALQDIAYVNKKVVMPDSVAMIFTEYEHQNLMKAHDLPIHEELKATELTHRHFKTLRLAGAYAFIDGVPEITEDHAYAAIKLAEDSGQAFNQLLTRERPFVKLAKYIVGSRRALTQADLVEDLPYYRGSVQQKSELMTLAIAHGYQNNMLIKKAFEEGIEFFRGETLEPTDLEKLVVSYSTDIAKDYLNDLAKFDELHQLTQMEGYHWCNHHFTTGNRRDEDAIPCFNMIVLDVDDGTPMTTAQMLLSDYKALFYTTRSSTPDHNRYRIILPTNYVLKLELKDYKEFCKNLFNWLPFNVDMVTGQRNRKWLSYNGHYEYQDGELLDVLPFIPKTSKNESFKQQQLDQAGLDNMERWMLNNTGDGNRNNMLLRYAMILVDAGLDFPQISSRVAELNTKLDVPLPEQELLSTIMQTVSKKIAVASQAA